MSYCTVHPSHLPTHPPTYPTHTLGVKARYLETALPPVGGPVLLLRGTHRLKRGKLLESDTRKEEGVVQLNEDLHVVRVSLDDIAEYRGRAEEEED